MIELYIRYQQINRADIRFIPPEPALGVVADSESLFVASFPFNLLSDWKILLWLINWNGNHWLIYMANRLNHTSTLLDPLTVTLSESQMSLYYKLNAHVTRLTYPFSQVSLSYVCLQHPLQPLSNDCGVFAASFATEYCADPLNPTFSTPDPIHIRKEMHRLVLVHNLNFQISKTSSEISATKDDSKSSELKLWVLEKVQMLRGQHTTPAECLDAVQVKVKELYPERHKGRIKPFHRNHFERSQQEIYNAISVTSLRKKMELHPKKTFDSITREPSFQRGLSLEQLKEHFAKPAPPPMEYPADFSVPFFEDQSSFLPFDSQEIRKALSQMDDSAPGDDGILASDWRIIDPTCSLLTEIFNLILLSSPPHQWLRFRTILVLKSGKSAEAHLPSSWRPISMLDTSYRIFSKALNARIRDWIQVGKLMIGNLQKAVGQPDGCSEHNFLISTAQEVTHRNKQKGFELHTCFLDFADAFGSLHHNLLLTTLRKMGLHPSTIQLIEALYKESTSSFSCGDIATEQIKILRGVKQGCPLSMTLFCLCIDFLLVQTHSMPGSPSLNGHTISSLAYADDLVLMATSNSELQEKVNTLEKLATWAHLKLRPAKCGYLTTNCDDNHLQIKIYNDDIPKIDADHLYTYLGVPLGSRKKQRIDDLISCALTDFEKILASALSYRQKVRCYQIFILPRFIYAFRTHNIPISSLYSPDNSQPADIQRNSGFDLKICAMIKEALGLPKWSINNDFIYASVYLGGLGLVPTYGEQAVQSINHAFRLLNSSDPMIKQIANAELLTLAKLAIDKSLPVDREVALKWLSNEHNLPPRSSHPPGTWWTRVRDAAIRLKKRYCTTVSFRPVENFTNVCLHFNSQTNSMHTFITAENRKELCPMLHDCIREFHYERWSNLVLQGSILDCANRSPFSSSVFRKDVLRDGDWNFALRARMNGNAVRANPSHRAQGFLEVCRRCGANKETQAHILCACPENNGLITKRHNAVALKCANFLSRFGLDVDYEVRPAEIDTTRQPDIIIRLEKSIILLDIKGGNDSVENFTRLRAANEREYRPLAEQMQAKTRKITTVETLIVGSIGCWDPRNDVFLRRLGLAPKDLQYLAESLCAIAVRESSFIMKLHRDSGPYKVRYENGELVTVQSSHRRRQFQD